MYFNFLGMQIVMIYFLWSGPMIPTSKVERENNKSWYWQRNMRQLLIFCLLLTSFPLHVICFTGYSLSEAFSNQVIQNPDCSFWITSSVKEKSKFCICCEHQIIFDLLIIWSYEYFDTIVRVVCFGLKFQPF